MNPGDNLALSPVFLGAGFVWGFKRLLCGKIMTWDSGRELLGAEVRFVPLPLLKSTFSPRGIHLIGISQCKRIVGSIKEIAELSSVGTIGWESEGPVLAPTLPLSFQATLVSPSPLSEL